MIESANNLDFASLATLRSTVNYYLASAFKTCQPTKFIISIKESVTLILSLKQVLSSFPMHPGNLSIAYRPGC